MPLLNVTPISFKTNWDDQLENHRLEEDSPGYKKYPKYSQLVGKVFHRATLPVSAAIATVAARSKFFDKNSDRGVYDEFSKKNISYYNGGRSRYQVLGALDTQVPHGQDVISQTSGEAAMPGPVKSKNGMGKSRSTSSRVTVKVPAATVTTNRVGLPSIRNGANTVRIVHRELIDTILCQQYFTVQNYSINPGLANVFPWLSTQAKGWERYVFNRLTFEYNARVGTNFAGSILMAPNYDAADEAPKSEQAMSAYEGAIESSAYHDFDCKLSTRDMLSGVKSKLLRYSPTSSIPGTTIREFDAGNLYVGSVDFPTANIGNPAGKLWVSYDVTFLTPRRLDVLTEAYIGSLDINGTDGITVGSPFGTAPAVLGGLDVAVGLASITFANPGVYMIMAHVVGTGLHTSFTPTGNLTSTNSNTDISATFEGVSNAAANAGTSAYFYAPEILINGKGDVLTFDLTGMATTITGMHMRIMPFSTTASS